MVRQLDLTVIDEDNYKGGSVKFHTPTITTTSSDTLPQPTSFLASSDGRVIKGPYNFHVLN